MALKLNERYPGRFDNPSADYPQGSFKNRSTPTAKDGSYLEKDWANDKEGFFQSLTVSAGIAPSGAVDKVGASQYFDALISLLNRSSSVVGVSRNLRCSVPVASLSAAITASEIAVKSALGGMSHLLSNFNKTINLATTGAGGMDTGSAPASGYVGIYVIYSPTSGASALLAMNATSAVAPSVYGGANMPAGYTASALVSVWPTNASGQFVVGMQRDRDVSVGNNTVLSTSTAQATLTSLSIAAAVPPNAVACRGDFTISSTTASAGVSAVVCGSPSEIGRVAISATSATTSAATTTSFPMFNILTQQTLYYRASVSAGTLGFQVNILAYSF